MDLELNRGSRIGSKEDRASFTVVEWSVPIQFDPASNAQGGAGRTRVPYLFRCLQLSPGQGGEWGAGLGAPLW